jgi:hypothetical protein
MRMPKTERGKEFDERSPALTDDEIGAAHRLGRSVLSFKARNCGISETEIGMIAIKFALADGSFETVIVDQLVARLLHAHFDMANRTGWKTETAALGTTRH